MSMQLPTADELSQLPLDGGATYNRLVFEKSPYLLQHATNPVDWYPWGNEAFALAQVHDKPVFLSVGYSTCHWCHVMEQESFEDPLVARLLNENFVNIKVDREERPDIDHVYMAVCQLMTGGGGWPMTVFMTPFRKPFFAGTYFPKEARFGRPGMLEMLPEIARVWREQREEVLSSADNVVVHLETAFSQRSEDESVKGEPEIDAMHVCYRQLASRFDADKGGFGEAPKFPTPHNLSFLLRYAARTGERHATDMVEQTLRAMRFGGIYDHIGHGFHRYSTDADWLVPHFEKMLYDQALLTIAYVEAYQATGHEEYAQTARETIEYVLRDMTSPDGGFYSAEDADSEGQEGKYYVWRYEDVVSVLGKGEADLFCKVYNILPGGNFENPHTPPESNIPYLKKPISGFAEELGVDEATLRSELAGARQRLLDARERRVHPHKDDKILTDWNGLMIAALARAGQALNEASYTAAAQRAADFVLTKLRDARGRLLKRYRDGEAGLPAHLDDYAFFVAGLLDLYEAGFEMRYLQAAITLNDKMLDCFWDDAAGGLFFTADDAEPLPVRTKTAHDGAIPSGNSVAMSNLLRLARILASASMDKKAATLARVFANGISQAPSGHTALLCALDFALGPSQEVIVVGKPRAEDTEGLLRVARRQFMPNKVVLFCPSDVEMPAIAGIVPSVAEHKAVAGKASAFVCVDHTCHPPVTSERELSSLLSATASAKQERAEPSP